MDRAAGNNGFCFGFFGSKKRINYLKLDPYIFPSGWMSTKPVSVKEIKPGHFIMIDGEPCKVMSVTKSKPGKHGATKARMESMGLFDKRKHELLQPTSANVDVPIIDKKKGQVISVSGDIAQLMDMEDYSTFEITIPEEFKEKLEAGKEVVYWDIAGRRLLREVR